MTLTCPHIPLTHTSPFTFTIESESLDPYSCDYFLANGKIIGKKLEGLGKNRKFASELRHMAQA